MRTSSERQESPVDCTSSAQAICKACHGSGEGRTVFNGYMDVLTACKACGGGGEVERGEPANCHEDGRPCGSGEQCETCPLREE